MAEQPFYIPTKPPSGHSFLDIIERERGFTSSAFVKVGERITNVAKRTLGGERDIDALRNLTDPTFLALGDARWLGSSLGSFVSEGGTSSFKVEFGGSESIGAGADQALLVGINGSIAAAADQTVGVGASVSVTGSDGTAVGHGSTAGAAGATSVGSGANASHASAIALGKGATTTTIEQLMVGSTLDSVALVVLGGKGDTHATPIAVTWRIGDGVGANISGPDLTIQPGLGTGSANSGRILFNSAPNEASGSTAHTAEPYMALNTGNAGPELQLFSRDKGAGATGPGFIIGRNSNASPSAGSLQLSNLNGTVYYYWVDSTGQLRVNTSAPTNATDLGGTPVGSSTGNFVAEGGTDSFKVDFGGTESIDAGAVSTLIISKDYSAGAAVDNSVIIGQSYTGTVGNVVAVGSIVSITGTGNVVAIGTTSIASTNAVAVGYGADAGGAWSVALGALSDVATDATGGHALGRNAVIGSNADYGTAVGYAASCGANHNDSVAIGRAATTSAAAQAVICNGVTPTTEVVLGGKDPGQDSGNVAVGWRIGNDAGTDQPGLSLTIGPGMGTGAGTPATIIFQTGRTLGTGLTVHTRTDTFVIGELYAELPSEDLAADATGPQLRIGRNSDATTPSAGSLRFTDKGGTDYFLWVDDTGALRINTSAPTGTGDLGGSLVGAGGDGTWTAGAGTDAFYVDFGGAESLDATATESLLIGHGGSIGSGVDQAIAFGNNVTVSGDFAVALGDSSTAAGALRSTAIGFSANSSHNNAIALGALATTTAANQFMVGSQTAAITTVIIGQGDAVAALNNVTLRITNASGTDVNGATLGIRPGMGTGAGTPGTIVFQTGRTLGTGTTLQTPATVLSLGDLFVDLPSEDTGNDVTGPQLRIGRNTNVTNSSAGSLRLTDKGGTDYFLWVDDSGSFRIDTAAPTGSTDTSGTPFSTGSNTFVNTAGVITALASVTTMHLADAATSATPSAATLTSQDASGTDTAGAAANVRGGLGTGAGAVGVLNLQVGRVLGTGSTLQTATTTAVIGHDDTASTGAPYLELPDEDLGSGVSFSGPQLRIGRNSNASPSAGAIRFTDKGGQPFWLWVDDDGDLRFFTSPPKNSASADQPATGWLPTNRLKWDVGVGGSTYFTQDPSGASSAGNGVGTVAVGGSVIVQNNGNRGCLLGGASQISGSTNHAVVVGYSSTAAHSDVVMLGAPGVSSTASNQMIVGGNNLGIGQITTLILGGRGDTYTAPDDVTWRISNGTGTDVAGGDLSIQAGMGTSAGAPGVLNFKIGRTLGTGSTLQTATTTVTIGERYLELPTEDTGDSSTGPQIRIGRNSNLTGASSGSLRFTDVNGTDYYLWVDDSGTFRIHTSAPTGATDTAGSPVATQAGSFIEGGTSSWYADLGGTEGVASATDSLVVGENASLTGSISDAIAIGHTASVTASNGLALGVDTTVAHNGSIAIGKTATTTATNQCVIGSSGLIVNTLILGGGDTRGTANTMVIRTTNGTGTDIDGWDLVLQGGQGTGAGAPGEIIFRVSRTQGTGSTLQSAPNQATMGEFFFKMNDEDTGANAAGPEIRIGRNTNASPSSGALVFTDKSGTDYYVHADDSGILRIGTTQPTGPNDTTNTVVGSQTSHVDAKTLGEQATDHAEAFGRVLQAAKHGLFEFSYKDDRFNGESFRGLILGRDEFETGHYAMDSGRALNEINAIGDLFSATQYVEEKKADRQEVEDLKKRIEDLEEKLAALLSQ